MGRFEVNISMTLDPDSVQKAIDRISDLTTDLQQALDALCEWLLKQGVTIARLKLLGYEHAKGKSARGNLYKSIRYEMANGKSGTGYLIAGYPGDHMSELGQYSNISYAVFFEFGFGTGTYYTRSHNRLVTSTESYERNFDIGNIGSRSGRTKAHPSGRDVYRKIESYNTLTDSNGKEFFGWVYKDRMSGKFFVSHGQNPKPFMYETLQELRSKAESESQRIIAEYIP